MKELSLHILDLAENSVGAKATQIDITIKEDIKENLLTISIKDNGCGMDSEMLKIVLDPFTTTRTTRRVGLGLPLFKAAAEECGGSLQIESKKGKGTTVVATFLHDHINRVPIGNMADTMITLLLGDENIEYTYTHTKDIEKFFFSTLEIKKILQGLSITDIEVITWIKDYIESGIKKLVKI
ncbi:ATP-binding protein [Alkaliphilus transvaalensis]|uniref:ATP-binding protein n=1 Tax=Alkaliphilus transvaalensis TaxID=114628 RepID=UPI000479D683|nr:ATP-binding protein [Alkaliphilus transvaalensis]